jgi:hypothetical protein
MSTEVEESGVSVDMWGGYSYSVGDPERFPSLVEACREYVRRMSPSNTYYPLWGECGPDDYVIVYDECAGFTLAEVLATVEACAEE